MVKDYDSGVLKPFNFNELLQRIPELYQLDCNIDTLSFDSPIDSSDMHPRDWVKIASIIEDGYENYDGFVVLHGSDTMSYTASALSFLLENLDKPVIFTGSQLPIGDLRMDAKENLFTSIQIASLRQNSKSVVREVGQGPLLPVPPALANAIYDAVGVRIDQVPIQPHMILQAQAARDRGEEARFGPTGFPEIDFGETLLVPTPYEGGDGRATNDSRTKRTSRMRGETGTMSDRAEALQRKDGALTTK